MSEWIIQDRKPPIVKYIHHGENRNHKYDLHPTYPEEKWTMKSTTTWFA